MGLFGRRRKNQPATGAATTATTSTTPPATMDKESLHGRMENLQAEMERVNKRHEAEMEFLNKRMVSMVAKVQAVPPPPQPSQQRRGTTTTAKKQQMPLPTSQLSNRSQRSHQSYQLDRQQQQQKQQRQRQQYQPRHNYQLSNPQGRTSTPPVSEVVILTDKNLETTAESVASNDDKSRDGNSHRSRTSKGRKVRQVVRTVRPIEEDAVSASPTVGSGTTESHASSHKSKDAPSSSEIEFRPTRTARTPTATAAAVSSTKKNIVISHSPPPRNAGVVGGGGGGGSNVKKLRERLFTDSMGAAASSSSGAARAAATATGRYDVVKKDATRAKWTPPSQPSNPTKQTMQGGTKKVSEKVVSTTYGRARASDPPGGRNVTRDPPEASRQWGQPKKPQQQQQQVNNNTETDDGVVHETTYGRNVTGKNKKYDNSRLKGPSSTTKPTTTGRPMPPISNANLLKEIRRQDVQLNKVSTKGDEDHRRVATKQTNAAKYSPGPKKTAGRATPPNFRDEIQQKNGQLRKTKQREPSRPTRMTPGTAGGSALSSNPPNDLLAGIRAGVKLKEVEKTTTEAPRPPQVSHMGALLAKIQERKQQIRESENEETDW